MTPSAWAAVAFLVVIVLVAAVDVWWWEMREGPAEPEDEVARYRREAREEVRRTGRATEAWQRHLERVGLAGGEDEMSDVDDETVWAVCPYLDGRHGEDCLRCPESEETGYGPGQRMCRGLAEWAQHCREVQG